jgi:hypothetical protein
MSRPICREHSRSVRRNAQASLPFPGNQRSFGQVLLAGRTDAHALSVQCRLLAHVALSRGTNLRCLTLAACEGARRVPDATSMQRTVRALSLVVH